MRDEVPKPDTAARGLATVIGENARRLRTGKAKLTLDQVSIAARMRGLNWSESRVADFESGRVAPNLATLIAVCLALADAGCADATFPELLRSESPIQINDSLLLSNEQVVDLLSGHPAGPQNPQKQEQGGVPTPGLPPPEVVNAAVAAFDATSVVEAVMKASGATEERTRKTAGISSIELARLSASMWGRSFSEERDRRAGEGANAQKRGQVTRQMRAELQAQIDPAHGDDK